MTTTIYLGGPMLDCTEEEMQDWRDEVQDEFTVEVASGAVAFLNPCARTWDGTQAGAEYIVERDLEDIDECDIVIANLWKIGVGTSMEVFYAAGCHGKLVITIVPEGRSVSPWLMVHSLVTRSVAEAVAVIQRELT